MRNLVFILLLFFTSMNFNNAFSVERAFADFSIESDFNKRIAHYMSIGMNIEDATKLTEDDQGDHISADASLARRIAAEDEEDVATTVRGINECIIVQTLLFNTNITTHRATVEHLVTFLGGIPQGADVHVLDGVVPGNMAALHDIGDDFAIDNSALTVANMRDYLQSRTTGYSGYDSTPVTAAELATDITNALSTASKDSSTLRMYSRVVSLIQNLEGELGQENESVRCYLKALFDAIAENRITKGGCFAGVRNRAYVRYVYMLRELMGT